GGADTADPGGHDGHPAHDLRARRARPVRRMSGRAAFLDRDGTINQKAPAGEYVTSLAEFHYLPGAEEAIRLLAGAGWRVIVVTNQRGIALGRMTPEAVDEIHRRLLGLPVAGVYVCPHEKGVCACR